MSDRHATKRAGAKRPCSNFRTSRSTSAASWRCRTSISRCGPAKSTAWSARTAPASRRPMKIIAGVHTEFDGVMKIKGREVRLRSARDALAQFHRHGAPGTLRRSGSDGRRERVPRQPAPDRDRHRRLGPHEPRGEEADRQPRPRHRSHHHHGLAARRACSSWSNCRACCSRARRSSFSTSRPRPCRRPKCAQLFEVLRRLRAEGRSIVFISHFLDDVLEISDRVTVFRNGQKVITEDTKNLDEGPRHRAHDRPRLQGHAHGRGCGAQGRRRQARGALRRRRQRRPQPARLLDRSARRRDHRRLWLHGLRPDRARPRAVRQGAAAPRQPEARRQAGEASARPRRRAPRASPSCRRTGA